MCERFMETKEPASVDIAELQVFIFQQQEIAGKLEREGDKKGARAARDRLYPLMHRLDLLIAGGLES
jgi:hypothetical protein